ncbi:MAG TPA: glycoside hydrolase family 9 protein [Verrucomicrobiae bacterium]|nr:glycoside hydrolase family 9 protein [Verrucomicrobiae bacterium]
MSLWAAAQQPLMEASTNSAANRWLDKKVLASRVLDDMEDPAPWSAFSTGAPEVVDARAAQKTTEQGHTVAEISFSHERSRGGRPSLRLRMPTRLEVPGPKNGRGWGSAGIRRQFAGEDWRQFNRLSLWIYPDCPGFQVIALELRLSNDGEQKLPALFGQEGETTVVLRNHEWNRVVWEIGNVARDKVTRLEVTSLMSGNEPEAASTLTYDFAHLELEQVEPDYIEGWDVWPGRISYSHAGYQPGARKSAIASGLSAKEFRVKDQPTGKTILAKPVKTVKTQLGQFQVMDFSEIRQSGSYILQAGDAATGPFQIDTNVWRETILKALNFLYAERCGMAIPGVHGICHRDWTAVHGDQRIVINGGWHDAGDLTQGLGNTGEIVYGLFSLAEHLHAMDQDPELYQRLLQEARWGLDWVLKTSFGDGFRNQGSISSRWTDGILGTSDDITSTARNSPLGNFTAAAAEAIAARVLKESDARLAAYSLKLAQADWHFACAGMSETNATNSKELWRGTFDSDNVEHEAASVGVLASVDLWRVTGNQQYADKAVELARIILDSQQRKRPNWEIPLFGFFYTGPSKDRILHYCHRGREQAPILALTGLCDAFPDHPDWMKWYSAVALYSQYLKDVAKYTQPYEVMPASIYQADEYRSVPESRRESFRNQVLSGIPLGRGHYLRLFPVWMDYRGHFGTILPQAQALASAAQLRGDLEAVALAQHQAEWIIGRNPFSQSIMYGEGYDFPPLYAPFPGNVVGALPVGIQTRGDGDVPYWPVQSTWTYKEVWVHPVGRWIWLMRDLAGPALVEGQADFPVQFIATGSETASVIRVIPTHGQFRVMLSEGKYRVRCQSEEHPETFLPAGTYHLDLRPGRALGFDVSRVSSTNGEVRIRLSAQGEGSHRFGIRADNLAISEPEKGLILKRGKTGTLEWSGKINSTDAPWVAVVVADENPRMRKELIGAAWEP